MKAIKLTGLDAQNPLGFLAALGLLRVLDDQPGRPGPRPRLSLAEGATAIVTDLSYDDVVTVVLADAERAASDVVLRVAYGAGGEELDPDDSDATRDLKPPPALARKVLERAACGPRSGADFAAGAFSELVQDNNGNTKPTALHFTAGKQLFLSMVDELRRGIGREHLDEALLGPWTNSSPLPSLSWDSSVSRMYALRAGDPSKEKRGSIPAANWLAVRGLPFFPVVVRKGRLLTAGIQGGWKDSALRWPTWSNPLTVPVIASLLRLDPTVFSAREREALGVTQVFAARIQRSDQGGYGSFSPADVISPKTH